MKNNSVVFFTDNKEKHKHLISLLDNNTNLSLCTYSSDSWDDIDFYSNNNVCYVLDEMPQDNKDAVWIISRLSEDGLFAEIPVLFTSFEAMLEFDRLGFASFAFDILPEPFEYEIAYRRFLNIIELRNLKFQISNLTQIHTKRILNQANKLKEQSAKMQAMNYDLVELLVAAIESRDLESGQHIKRIRYFTKALTDAVAEQCPEYSITKEQAEYIYYASSVHDIGKIAIPDAIMLKSGRLTPDEFDIMKTHTVRGYNLLNKLDGISVQNQYFKYCQEICRYHHERWDGRGYPEGLVGDETPISAQIVALCDCYDALTSSRPYKTALSHQDAVDLILSGGCGAFSPQILKCFNSVLSEFNRIESEFKNHNTESEDAVFKPISIETIKSSSDNSTYISKLSESEERIISSHDIVFEADIKNGYFSVLRGSWTNFFPYVPKNFTEVIAQCLKLCHPADAARFASKVNIPAFSELCKRGKTKTRVEFRLIYDGIEYLAVGVIVFVTDDDKNLIGLNGIFNIYDDEEILVDIKRGFGVTDTLTGLSLQKQFEKDVNAYIKDNLNSKSLLIHIDIDDMSMCNNIFGYEFGNALIKEFASKLRSISNTNTILCKATSDKFLLFVKNVTNQAEVVIFIENLHNLLRKPYSTATESGEFTASMGIARYPNDGKDFKSLAIASEYAAKTAKINGNSSYAFFNNSMQSFTNYSTEEYGGKKRNDDDGDDYTPKFIPVVDAKTGDLVCYDYIPYSMYEDSVCLTTEAYYELNKDSANSKNLTVLSIKSLLFTLISIKRKVKNIPPVSVYATITGDDLPSFIQELSTFTSENDCSGIDLCILFPQDILEEVHISRIKSFSEYIHKLGFKIGLYLLGSRYIHNRCHSWGVFDRFVMKSEYIEHSIGSSKYLKYCCDTLNVLKKFVSDLTIPTFVSDYDKEVMFGAGVCDFSVCEEPISGTTKLIKDYNGRKVKVKKHVSDSGIIRDLDPAIVYHDIINSKLAWLFYDTNNKNFSVSANIEEVLGVNIFNSKEAPSVNKILSMMHPDDVSVFLAELSKVRMNLDAVNFSLRLKMKEDSDIYNTFGITIIGVVGDVGSHIRYQCSITKLS